MTLSLAFNDLIVAHLVRDAGALASILQGETFLHPLCISSIKPEVVGIVPSGKGIDFRENIRSLFRVEASVCLD